MRIYQKLKDINLFNEILNMTFEDSIHKLFMMSSNDYKAKYSFENKFLFEKMEDKSNMKNKDQGNKNIRMNKRENK